MKCHLCNEKLYLLVYHFTSKTPEGKYTNTTKNSGYLYCNKCRKIFKIQDLEEES